jgi:hypothetical protein
LELITLVLLGGMKLAQRLYIIDKKNRVVDTMSQTEAEVEENRMFLWLLGILAISKNAQM